MNTLHGHKFNCMVEAVTAAYLATVVSYACKMFMKLGKGLQGGDSEQNKNIKIEIVLMVDTPGTKPGYLMTKSIIISKENFHQNFNVLFLVP